ncbi:MAG: hypothetical protein DRN20_06870, partial [Thermoplasmata archaeon]
RYLYVQGKISEEEYRKYLARARIPAEWHDLFVELANLERMRKSREEEAKERSLTYTQYAQAFRRGIIGAEEFKAKLLDLGFSEESADILVAVEEDRKYQRLEEALLDALDDLYRYGILDDTTYVQMLREAGASDYEVSLRKKIADLRRLRRRRRLTTSQILRALKGGIVDVGTAVEYLRALGYGDFEISVLLQLYAAEMFGVSAG